MYDIRDIFLFKGLAENETNELVSDLGTIKKFSKGDSIYDCRNFRKALGVLLKGNAAASADGVQKTEFKEGAVFGAASLFGCGDKYVSKITAKTGCEVLFVSEDVLCHIIKKYPQCALNYVEFLTKKIRYLNVRIGEFTGANISGRLYRHLCENADENGKVIISNMASLAKIMGIGRTSLYRSLSELEEKGIIKRKDDEILLLMGE